MWGLLYAASGVPANAAVSKKAAEYLMSEIAFLLNGEVTRVADAAPTRTLLDWLREERALTGTKEGCNEGDCGACTVIVTDKSGSKSMNACILLLPQLHGRAVRTVEGISGPKGELHPVQQAMIDHHGSQCGFCTPGFITAMATAHKNGRKDHNDQLAGNLCRCTGYAPIIRAAEAVQDQPVPAWMEEDLSRLSGIAEARGDWARPETTVELAKWYLDHPTGTLVGGATDIGLWVTKDLRDLGPVAFLDGIDDLSDIHITDDRVRIGAAATIAAAMEALAPISPDFAELLRRYGSAQVRSAATIGGNIANASPIGDTPPALIALGATLHLRRGVERRDVLLENYFIDYGKQDRVPGEFVEAVSFPRTADRLKCYKLSKRFDQDISAVLGCFNVRVIHGVVTSARIAFGGMAGIPKRARAVETSLIGKAWDENAADRSWDAFERDFAPMSDMRASAEYRLEAARGMLMRYLLEDLGAETRVLDVSPPQMTEPKPDVTASESKDTDQKSSDPELAAVAAAAAAAASAAADEVAAGAPSEDAPVTRADTDGTEGPTTQTAEAVETAASDTSGQDTAPADPSEATEKSTPDSPPDQSAEPSDASETAGASNTKDAETPSEEASQAAGTASEKDTPAATTDETKPATSGEETTPPAREEDAAPEADIKATDTSEQPAETQGESSSEAQKSEAEATPDTGSDAVEKSTETSEQVAENAEAAKSPEDAPQDVETGAKTDDGEAKRDAVLDEDAANVSDDASADKDVETSPDESKPEETPPEEVAIILPPPPKDPSEDKS